MNNNTKKTIISIAVGVLVFVFSYIGVFDRLDFFLSDAVYQRPVATDHNVKIIAIDEKTLDALGPLNTWDRSVFASLLYTLYAEPDYSPSLVAFDMLFTGNTDEESDRAFARAARDVGLIVSAANLVFKDSPKVSEDGSMYIDKYNVDTVELPYDALAGAAYVGFANSFMDEQDSRIRTFTPIIRTGDRDFLLSLAYMTASVLEERGIYDINFPSPSIDQSFLLRYSGNPGDYTVISLIDILNGEIPYQTFKDSVFFVGAYAPGMQDSFSVPVNYGKQMYGVEIHANIFQSITTGRYMFPADRFIYSLMYGFVALIFAMLALFLPFIFSPFIAAAMIIVLIVTGGFMADSHVFIPLLTLPVSLILTIIGILLYRYFSTLSQRRRVLKAFRQYVAPQIVGEISKKGDFKISLGGRKRDIAVLFVDIRGFTPLSEALEPEQVVEILNEYLSHTTRSIFNNMGTLDKFIGDATMAVFNSPFDLEDYVFKAVCAARDIAAGSQEVNSKALELTGCEVGFGVGVNCGPAIVGNIGSDFRMDYTAIGDTVNTAARLESQAKAGQVLLSQTVVDTLGDRISVQPVGNMSLKGKALPVMVYELIDIKKDQTI